MAFAEGEGAKDVHSPLCEGPWGYYRVKLLFFLVDKVAMLLAWYAFFDKVLAVGLHGWLEVTGAKDSGSHGVCAKMIAAYALL